MLFSLLGYAQTKQAFIQAAEESYANKNYYAALSYFEEALLFGGKEPELIFKAAESARMFNSYKIAAAKYSLLIDTLENDSYPIAYFHLAEMYQKMGRYDEALNYYTIYKSEYATDENDFFNLKAAKEIKAVEWAKKLIKEVDESVEIKRYAESDVNSPQTDFAPQKVGDTLFFSSMRFFESKPLTKPAREISKLMRNDKKNGTKILESVVNQRDTAVANACFNKAGDMIYYTVCTYKTASELTCMIYVSDYSKDGKLSNERKLPAPINIDSFSTTQPSIGIDPKTGAEVLFFASDRKGGMGKFDIYYAVIDKKLGYSTPVNIKEINTSEDDMTPFYHLPTQTLYFSSEGKIGFGGFDICSSKWQNGTFGAADVLPAPYNSSYHDNYFFLSDDGMESYFASNREGATFIDDKLQACCFDIFRGEITKIEIDLLALTFDADSQRPLPGATVKVYNATTGELIATLTNEDGNEFKMKLDRNTEYKIVAEKEHYLPETVMISTKGLSKNTTITRKLYLKTDKIILDVFTFDAEDKSMLDGAMVTIEDLSDPTVPPIEKFNPVGNNFKFFLEPGKLYKVTARKDKYAPASAQIETRSFSKGQGGLIRKDLFLSKFSLEGLLPIALYFDNDQPDGKASTNYTPKKYSDLLDKFMARKTTFMESYTAGLKGAEKDKSIKDMENFFEGNVKGGFDKYRIFMDLLLKELQSGRVIMVKLTGSASPRWEAKYNVLLSAKRAASVRNDIEAYDNGVFVPYLKSRQLILDEVTYGSVAPSDVPSSLADTKGSIYSVKASLYRKVEIFEVTRLK